MDRERAIDLCKGNFGKESLKSVANYAAPLFWVTADDNGEHKINNGSIFFVDASEGLLAITANHVFEKYIEVKGSSSNIYCQIARNCFDPIARETIHLELETCLIDKDPEADIATFRISEADVETVGATVLKTWPPLVPQEGLGVAFTGYPSHGRQLVGPQEISFTPFPTLTIATSVSHRLISCQLERECLVDTPGFSKLPSNFDTGGLSGGPLLVNVEKNGIFYWRLGGVITQGNSDLEIVRASRVDHLRPDGTFAQ